MLLFNKSETIQTKIILFLIPKEYSKISSIYEHLNCKIRTSKNKVSRCLFKLQDNGVIQIENKNVSLLGDNNDIAVFRDMVFVYHKKESLIKLGSLFGLNEYIISLFLSCCYLNGKLESKYTTYFFDK